eukprot:364044-Chlamydomonas_euryale.AAC.8
MRTPREASPQGRLLGKASAAGGRGQHEGRRRQVGSSRCAGIPIRRSASVPPVNARSCSTHVEVQGLAVQHVQEMREGGGGEGELRNSGVEERRSGGETVAAERRRRRSSDACMHGRMAPPHATCTDAWVPMRDR